MLLEYVLGQEHSHVFAVGSNSLASYELPKSVEIEKAVRRWHDLLTAADRVVKGESAAQRMVRLETAEKQYPAAAARLSQMVLGPVASLLHGKRLLIVSDGSLQYVSFAALPIPGRTTSDKRPIPLVVEHEIVYLPAASVLAVLRREAQGRKPAPKAVAVLGDPVLSRQDALMEIAAAKGRKARRQDPAALRSGDPADAPDSFEARMLTRSVEDAGLSDLPRLLFSRREAEAIFALTPPGQGKLALRFDASRETATSPELALFRILHFATHGLLDSQHPELSGLVLSLVDKHGKWQNGFLTLQDIYNLNLPVDLVVLSACETGLGKEIRGEGLIGLTRGFMYAGATRVVASLWQVDDASTADLMTHFYQAMEKQGMSPAAALRQAQIQMWKDKQSKRWNNPDYWAAFQLQGEWK